MVSRPLDDHVQLILDLQSPIWGEAVTLFMVSLHKKSIYYYISPNYSLRIGNAECARFAAAK